MDELFSCRNCIHNAAQTLNVGGGIGLCLQHGSVLVNPIKTTCKYHHRRDLPWFVVDEGRSEHAAEFSGFSGLADLHRKVPVAKVFYSERFAWENKAFDSVTNALARYHQSGKKWIFIEAFTGGVDGRRAVAQSSLTRRYMSNCNSWRSSFRLTLDVVSQLAITPAFVAADLFAEGGGEEEALWDVVFSRLALVQEYGWHAGLEELQWMTDSISTLHDFEWGKSQDEISSMVPAILDTMFRHASENDGYFESASEADQSPEDPLME